MIISSKSLPSNGMYKASDSIEILPLTYNKVMKYESNNTGTLPYLLTNEIETLISTIKNWDSLLLYDYDSIAFSLRYISVTNKPIFDITVKDNTCPSFVAKFDVGSLKFRSLTEKDLKIKDIEIGGIRYPLNFGTTIRQFYEMLLEFRKWDIAVSKSDLIFLAMISSPLTLNSAYSSYMNATQQDIALIRLVKNLLVGSAYAKFKCPHCGKEVVVGLDDLITDIFHLIDLNSDLSGKLSYSR